MSTKNANGIAWSIGSLLADPLIQLVMTADRVQADDLWGMLEDVARQRRIPSLSGPMAIPGEVSIVKRGDDAYREGVGMIVLNSSGHVLVGRRLDDARRGGGEPTWQMPQGGIELGETPREAALRELREEIGTNNVEIIAESRSWFRYDLPGPLRPRPGRKAWLGQQQKWFVMRFLGKDAEIHVATEHPEFDAWRWILPETATDLVVYFKRDLYRRVMSELADAVTVA